MQFIPKNAATYVATFMALVSSGLSGLSASAELNAGSEGSERSAKDATSTQAPSAPTLYKSPFSDYHPLGEDQRKPWKAANDEVGKIGGWRVYAREAAAPSGTASPSRTQTAPNTAPVLASQPSRGAPSPALPTPPTEAKQAGQHAPEAKK